MQVVANSQELFVEIFLNKLAPGSAVVEFGICTHRALVREGLKNPSHGMRPLGG